jgi:hypothetical protein
MRQTVLEFLTREGDKYKFVISEEGYVLRDERIFSNGDRSVSTYLIDVCGTFYYVKETQKESIIGGVITRNKQSITLITDGYIDRREGSSDDCSPTWISTKITGVPPSAQLYKHYYPDFPQFSPRGNISMNSNSLDIVHGSFKVVE